jgi:hypothetical protein
MKRRCFIRKSAQKRLLRISYDIIEDFIEDFDITDNNNTCELEYILTLVYDENNYHDLNVDDSKISNAFSGLKIKFSKEEIPELANKLAAEIERILGTKEIIYWIDNEQLAVELNSFNKLITKKDLRSNKEYDENNLKIIINFGLLINDYEMFSAGYLNTIGFSN